MQKEITVPELLTKLDRGEPVLLLDVRNEDEFASWKFEGKHSPSAINIPYFAFLEEPEATLARVPAQGAAEWAVLCAKGGSSEYVADLLREAGIPARNITGGMLAYGSYIQPVRVVEESQTGPEIWQLNRRGKGCLSYIVRVGGEAIVVDPSRHVQLFLDFVNELDAKLVRVLDTHVHADHVSGGVALAKMLGIPYSVAAGPEFEMRQPALALRDGEELALGGKHGVLRVISTPGHTPGSTSYLAGQQYLLSGDSLFVNGIGRPDLGGDAAAWATWLFETLRHGIGSLPDDVVVLPAHYSSMSEIGPDGAVSARLGDIRANSPEFRIPTEEEFVAVMTRGAAPAPPAYTQIIHVNLGLTHADEEQMSEWELGKNECAAHSTH